MRTQFCYPFILTLVGSKFEMAETLMYGRRL